MIKIQNLQKYYDKELAINDVSLKIKKGEIYVMVGHSGAGKSTLLRCINGLESYQKGSLKVFDLETKDLPENEPEKLKGLRKDVGMIFQSFALMNRRNVSENIAMSLRTHYTQYKITASLFKKDYMSEDDVKKRIDELLDIVGLSYKKSSYPKGLGGGQKQRVAIARALALNPKVLLSDEVILALDPNTTKNISELILKVNKEFGISAVLVTHEVDVIKDIAQKAVLLEQGQTIGSGKIDELFLKPNAKMREFLGESDFLPENGLNTEFYFPKEAAQNSVMAHMAKTLNIDFNIVWGKIEKFNGAALGNLVININGRGKEKVLVYIEKSGILWEMA